MDQALLRDVIEWDTVTWGRAVSYWQAEQLNCTNVHGGGAYVLDIGSRGGGLSLMFALMGCQVHCTDLKNPKETAGPLHQRYGVESRITYWALDALKLNEEETYDIICFKSVLGGVGHHDNYEAQQKMMYNIYRALKPGGYLFFAENVVASPLHRFLRKHFISWSRYWRYVTLEEVDELCCPFSEVWHKNFGFLGAMGRNERQRVFLGSVDRLLDRFIPASAKYCVSVVAKK